MCYICRNVSSMLLKNNGPFCLARQRRLLSSSNLTSATGIACGPPQAVACDLPQLPRRIRRSWLSAPLTSSAQIRSKFLEYFASMPKPLSHTVVPSSSVIAREAEGSFFINAGMNQFKSRILDQPGGARFSDVDRAVSVQRCLRVGGRRHNDLESAGLDGCHHTFFEMLGNWSFGDYWKREACRMAWKFLTEEMKLPASQLYVTYFGGCPELGLPADSETRDIWLSLGVSDQRLLPFGIEHNFWEMGDSGPCGVSTEIHFDHVGGRCARCFVNSSAPDVLELWNLVFMNRLRVSPGDRELSHLSMRTVDTGMGLERLTALMQGVTSAYDTDLFEPLFASLASQSSGGPAYSGAVSPQQPAYRLDTSLRIVADHARALTVAIGDGMRPGPRGSEHKLRLLAARAAMHAAFRLKLRPGSLARLAPLVAESLAPGHPEMAHIAARDAPALLADEEAAVLSGLPMDRLTPAALAAACQSPETLADFLAEVQCSIDALTFFADLHSVPLSLAVLTSARELLIKRGHNRNDRPILAATQRNVAALLRPLADQLEPTNVDARYEFRRFDDRSYEFPALTARIIGLAVQDNEQATPRLVESLDLSPPTEINATEAHDRRVYVVLDQTSFYCESGGQLSDMAKLSVPNQPTLEVTDAVEVSGRVFHRVELVTDVSSSMGNASISHWSAKIGSVATLTINSDRRVGLMRHHTATHALSSALAAHRPGAIQRSSCVRPDELTLGVSVGGADLDNSDLAALEVKCRQIIDQDYAVGGEWMSLKQADSLTGVRRLPNVEYADRVKVVRFLPRDADNEATPTADSGELCCGTHLARTGDLLDILIVSSTASGRGQRELRALAGPAAVEARRRGAELLASVSLATASEIRRRLGGPQPLGRLHRAAIERALDDLSSQEAVHRSEEHAAAAKQIVGELLDAAASAGQRRLIQWGPADMKNSMRIGAVRALFKAIGASKDELFHQQGDPSHFRFLSLNLGSKTVIVASETQSASLQSLIESAMPSNQQQQQLAGKLKHQHGLVTFDLANSDTNLGSVLQALENYKN